VNLLTQQVAKRRKQGCDDSEDRELLAVIAPTRREQDDRGAEDRRHDDIQLRLHPRTQRHDDRRLGLGTRTLPAPLRNDVEVRRGIIYMDPNQPSASSNYQ
jgi:hypothetical protein